MKSRVLASMLTSAALMLSACGGGDGDDPTPTPTPSPTPTPGPTPTPTPTPPPTDANILGVSLGASIPTLLNCAGTPVFDATGLLTGVTGVGEVVVNSAVIGYTAADTFSLTINGTTGPVFSPTEKVNASDSFVTWLSPEPAELQIVRKDRFASTSVTLGVYAKEKVCFAGGGLTPTGIPTTGTTTYKAFADGLAVNSAGARRLFLASTGTVAFDAPNKKATVTINFAALDNPAGKGPFVDISGRTAVPITTATATLTTNGASLTPGTFTGGDGYTGTIYGSFVGANGILLPFVLKKTSGETIYGIIAADKTLP